MSCMDDRLFAQLCTAFDTFIPGWMGIAGAGPALFLYSIEMPSNTFSSNINSICTCVCSCVFVCVYVCVCVHVGGV